MADYAQFVADVSNLTVIDTTDADFQQILTAAINDAEQRCYRELDLLSTVVAQTTTLTSGTRQFPLPTGSGRFVVTNFMNVITPSSATDPDSGTRNPLTPVSPDVLNMIWPSSTGAGVPTLYAMLTDQTVLLGPWPDDSYTIEIAGTIRPDPLSATNTTTYLTLYLYDLFLSAAMSFMTAYMRDTTPQSDNPNLNADWESRYMKEFASANIEEQRKRYASYQSGSLQPAPISTPAGNRN